MLMSMCNPYAPSARETCAAMALPVVTVNPYQPDADLRDAGYILAPLPSLDDAPFYVPPVEEPWHVAMARDIYQSRTEDELAALVYAPHVAAFAAQTDAQAVPEAPAGALLLTAIVLVGLWKVAR